MLTIPRSHIRRDFRMALERFSFVYSMDCCRTFYSAGRDIRVVLNSIEVKTVVLSGNSLFVCARKKMTGKRIGWYNEKTDEKDVHYDWTFDNIAHGCGKTDITKTYKKSENDGIIATYYEMNNGTWQSDDRTYQFRLELTGRMPNAESDSLLCRTYGQREFNF